MTFLTWVYLVGVRLLAGLALFGLACSIVFSVAVEVFCGSALGLLFLKSCLALVLVVVLPRRKP